GHDRLLCCHHSWVGLRAGGFDLGLRHRLVIEPKFHAFGSGDLGGPVSPVLPHLCGGPGSVGAAGRPLAAVLGALRWIFFPRSRWVSRSRWTPTTSFTALSACCSARWWGCCPASGPPQPSPCCCPSPFRSMRKPR